MIVVKVISKTNGVKYIESPTYATYADLPLTAAGGQIEYVRQTTGLIGFRKFAGWWIYEDGWQLLEKATEE